MIEIENCSRCGKSCDTGGVYSPQTGTLCHDCFNAKEWKEIKAEQNRKALPWKILLGVMFIYLILKIML